MGAHPVAADKLDAYGIDAVCDDIRNLKVLREIADEREVALGSLLTWLDKPAHSARAQDARRSAARAWEEEAQKEIKAASTGFELQKAQALAHHYRWRAAMIDPTYRQKVDHTVANPPGEALEVKQAITVATMTAEQAYAQMMKETGK